MPSSGSLTVEGTITDLGLTAATLLTGDIVAFGFADPAEPVVDPDHFEFIFSVTGGSLTTLAEHGPGYWWSDRIIVNLDAGVGTTGFDGYWDTGFENLDTFGNHVGLADTYVPEPSSLLLLTIGGFAFLAGKWYRRFYP